MKPMSPVVPGFEGEEIVFAKDQPEYIPLPALPVDSAQKVITRWRLSWRERLQVLFHGDVYLWVWTFRRPLQPVALETSVPALGEMKRGRCRDEKRESSSHVG
jgi:hypothetical protein